MKTDQELIIIGIKEQMFRLNKAFHRILCQENDIIADDGDWMKLKELKAEYDELQYRLLNYEPVNTEEIPF